MGQNLSKSMRSSYEIPMNTIVGVVILMWFLDVRFLGSVTSCFTGGSLGNSGFSGPQIKEYPLVMTNVAIENDH